MIQTRQLTFDDAEAQAAKAEGMKRVWDGTREEWRAMARAYVRVLLLSRRDGAEVTPDDIRAAVPIEPHHPNSWGPFVTHLVAIGWLTYVGRQQPSVQSKGHGNKNEVYRINREALIHGERAA